MRSYLGFIPGLALWNDGEFSTLGSHPAPVGTHPHFV